MALPVLPGLSFTPGKLILGDAMRILDQPITRPASDSESFALVVAFGRCKFRLDPCSVGVILQATIGGSAPLFRVSQLAPRTFKFFVASKDVGFFIVNIRSFSCEQYLLTFHLWRKGGPDWRRKFKLFLAEEERSWQLTSKRRPSTNTSGHVQTALSFADVVRSGRASDSGIAPPLTGANIVPLPQKRVVFRHLQPPVADVCPKPRFGMPVNGGPTRKSANDSLEDSRLLPLCQRCLSPGHHRASCRRPIQCRACADWGHIAANCGVQILSGPSKVTSNSKKWRQVTDSSKSKTAPFGWFSHAAIGPSSSSPPRFSSFTEMAQALSLIPAWAAGGIAPAFTTPQAEEPNAAPQNLSLDLFSLSLAPPASTFSPASASPRENPTPVLQCAPVGGVGDTSVASTMAYQRADPEPFILDTFQWVDVPNREFMCRAVAPLRPIAANEDLAIVTFDPLPGNALHFGMVRNIVRDFLVGHRIVPRAILPCHLGQAYVRFHHAYGRDAMIDQSPMGFHNIQISFVKHNEGRNWRRVYFNEECWMMLLGFPEDYKSERHI